MAFRGFSQLAQAVATDGQEWLSFFRKSAPAASARWVDGSVGSGIPLYNAYVGAQLEATALTGVGNAGIYTGPAPAAGEQKYLHALQVLSSAASVPNYLLLADYLLFYPLLDGDNADEQVMTNAVSLPRYASGDGVQCMVVTQVPNIAAGTMTVSYTNQAGVSGRSTTFGLASSAVIGALANTSSAVNAASATGPFIPLQSGDRGIRSIESATISGAPSGFYNLVLVKPITGLQLREVSTAAEKVMLPNSGTMPEILPGAYLNFLVNNGGASAPLFQGFLQFVWG
jgi:hypothetical protein